jgi:hypothetical protein
VTFIPRKGISQTNDSNRPQQFVEILREVGLGAHMQLEMKIVGDALDMRGVGQRHINYGEICEQKIMLSCDDCCCSFNVMHDAW